MTAPSSGPRHAVSVPEDASIPLPRRKNIRMQGWDFTSPGWYFLTLCTQNMRSVFGTIVNGRMILNDAGRHADAFWREIPVHFPRAVVDEHVVMPNHVHGLLCLTAAGWDIQGFTARREAFGKPVAGSVPTIVRSYKAAVSRALGESVWQSRFYEVRARDEAARANIRRYIRANPENYEVVASGVKPASLGNKALLAGPKLGFLASRGATTPHGSLPLKPGEAIMSGFLSPMEQAVFQAKAADLKVEIAKVEEALARATVCDPDAPVRALALFDFSQQLVDVWHRSNSEEKRQVLDCVSLNRTVTAASLCVTKRKPFDWIAERPFLKNGRGGGI